MLPSFTSLHTVTGIHLTPNFAKRKKRSYCQSGIYRSLFGYQISRIGCKTVDKQISNQMVYVIKNKSLIN